LDGTLAATKDYTKQELPEVSISFYGHGNFIKSKEDHQKFLNWHYGHRNFINYFQCQNTDVLIQQWNARPSLPLTKTIYVSSYLIWLLLCPSDLASKNHFTL